MESFDRNGLSLWQLIIRDKRYRWWLFFFLKIFNTFFRLRNLHFERNESETFKNLEILSSSPFLLLTNGLNFKSNKNEFLYCFDVKDVCHFWNCRRWNEMKLNNKNEIFKILKFYFSFWQKFQFLAFFLYIEFRFIVFCIIDGVKFGFTVLEPIFEEFLNSI